MSGDGGGVKSIEHSGLLWQIRTDESFLKQATAPSPARNLLIQCFL